QHNRAVESILAPNKDREILMSVLQKPAGVGMLVGRGHGNQPEIRPIRNNSQPIIAARTRAKSAVSTGHLNEIFSIRGDREAISRRIGRAREKLDRRQRRALVVEFADLLVIGGVPQGEVDVGLSADPLTEEIKIIDLAFFGAEGIPILVVFLFYASGNLAREGDGLGRLGAIVGLIVQNNRRPGVSQEKRIGG